MKHTRLSLVLLAVAAALTGCYDSHYQPRPAQMTQACGQSMQTGQMECVAVPVGTVNPYVYPAPAQYYHDHGYGNGALVGAAALGYMAGRSNNVQTPSYNRSNTTVVHNYYAPPNTNSYARTAPVPATPAPVRATSAFQPRSAANTQTVTPMSITQPRSAPPPAPVVAPARPAFTSRPASSFTSRPASSFSSSSSKSSFTPRSARR